MLGRAVSKAQARYRWELGAPRKLALAEILVAVARQLELDAREECGGGDEVSAKLDPNHSDGQDSERKRKYRETFACAFTTAFNAAFDATFDAAFDAAFIPAFEAAMEVAYDDTPPCDRQNLGN